MRKISKIINIAVILIIGLAWVGIDISYALRPALQCSATMKESIEAEGTISEEEFGRILSALTNTVQWQQQRNLSFFISGVSDKIAEGFLKRLREFWIRHGVVSEDNIICEPLHKLVNEVKNEGVDGQRNLSDRMRNKIVFIWGYYPFSEEYNHSNDDVLIVFDALRATHMSTKWTCMVFSEREFDHSEYREEKGNL